MGNDTASALKAINLTISQGEGSTSSPVDTDGTLSHYYRFAQVFHRRAIQGDANEEVGFSYTGAELAWSEHEDVYPIIDNITAAAYEGEQNIYVRMLNEDFNRFYTEMLDCLQYAFTDTTDLIRECVAMMTVLKEKQQAMHLQPVYGADGKWIGSASPTYEYQL
eukprot:NODE_6082_length_531_cov_180.510504.p2 GENE.NODE_6082_length_531_cov_180.510504~~NODE_6082_length_531_cov_180.510504.p2  ORF type:complete len:164 (+),score=56.92 NODE_6082_length_531_cov_180.510504:3-494(+)